MIKTKSWETFAANDISNKFDSVASEDASSAAGTHARDANTIIIPFRCHLGNEAGIWMSAYEFVPVPVTVDMRGNLMGTRTSIYDSDEVSFVSAAQN